MRHFLRSSSLSAVLLFSGLTPLAIAQTSPPAAPTRIVAPKTGEIMLEGTITKINFSWSSITMTLKATAFATPGKEIKPLPAAKDKPATISFLKANLQFAEGTPQPLHDIPNAVDVLAVGQKVRVIGPDGGTGSTLNATLIATDWKGDGQVIEGTTQANPPQYGHKAVRVVIFSGDGKLMATAGDWDSNGGGKSIKIWDAESGRVLHAFDFDQWSGDWLVDWLRFSPDGKMLFAQVNTKEEDPDSFYFVWDVAAEQYRITRNEGNRERAGWTLSPDGKLAAVCSGSKYYSAFESKDFGVKQGLNGSTGIKIFRVDDWKLLHEITDPDAIAFASIAFSQDGKLLYSLGPSNVHGTEQVKDKENLKVWDVESGKKVRSLPFPAVSFEKNAKTGLFRMASDRDPDRDALKSKNFRIDYEDWSLNETGMEKMHSFKGLSRDELGLRWTGYGSSPGGEFLAFLVSDETDKNKGHLVFLKASDSSIVKSPDYTGARTWTFPSFTSDGKFFAITETGKGVTLFDVATGQQVRTITLPPKPQ